MTAVLCVRQISSVSHTPGFLPLSRHSLVYRGVSSGADVVRLDFCSDPISARGLRFSLVWSAPIWCGYWSSQEPCRRQVSLFSSFSIAALSHHVFVGAAACLFISRGINMVPCLICNLIMCIHRHTRAHTHTHWWNQQHAGIPSTYLGECPRPDIA